MNTKKTFTEKIQKRESLFKGKYLELDRLEVKLPDGRTGVRECVRVRNSVSILPLDENGNVHLVRQHRPAIGRTILEAPAGLLDHDETCENAACRECEEETGFFPHKLEKLLTYAHAEGYSTGFMTLFLGTDLENTGKMKLDSTEFLEPVAIPFSAMEKMVEENQIIDSKTILFTLLIKNRLTEQDRSIPSRMIH
jgi:ADP-ribose pyrophosphatase